VASSKRYESLDGLRGICALMVAIFHCDDHVLKSGHLLNRGYLSVDAFFVISGFVIAHVYENRLAQDLTIAGFLRARARRLFPVQMLGTAVVAIVAILGINSPTLPFYGDSITRAVMLSILALFLIPDPVALVLYPANGPLWSLLDEWLVNTLYALGLRRCSISALLAIAVLSMTPLVFLALAVGHNLVLGTAPGTAWVGAVRALFGFSAGVVVLRFHVSGALARLPHVSPMLVYAIAFFIASMPLSFAPPIFDVFAICTFPLLVALLAESNEPPHRVFLFLGRISYPLYVSQFALIYAGMRILDRQSGPLSAIYALPIIAAMLVLAWLIDLATTRKPRLVAEGGTI